MSSVVEPPPPAELVSEPSEPAPPAPATPSKRRRTLLRDILEVLALAFALYIVIAFALQTVRVEGESMEPTLQNSDLLFADKLSYHLHAPGRGDIIVLRPPDQSDNFIKRIIAVPDDFVEIDGKHISADGTTSVAVLIKSCATCTPEVVKEPYLPDQTKDPWTQEVFCCDSTGHASGEPTWLHVPQDMYFVLGDNRNHSRDSRSIGLIPRGNIEGRAWVRIWPLSHFGFLGQGPTMAATLAAVPVPFWTWRRRRRATGRRPRAR